jgi:murein tripeptide amidase MpaA
MTMDRRGTMTRTSGESVKRVNRRGLVGALAAIFALGACAPGPESPGEEGLVGADGTVDWNRYYLNEETNRIMEAFTRLYPELTELRSIGRSYLGVDLMLMTVTSKATGPASEKPALYLDGGIHAQELTSSSVALYVLAHLLNNYGTDSRITELLDTYTFYIRPKFNPDGSDLVLLEDQFLRSSVRPIDENGDGIPDSDPPEDLDGDGRILTMRVPDPDGNMRVSDEDPRIMVRQRPGDAGPFYRTLREGVDRNGDGTINSDGIGGVDMNRNFPRNWERWHVQSGSGDFPLSEPETYATVRFLNENRNVGTIVHGHTSGGFVYRLPSAMDPAEFNANDEALVIHLGSYYTETTGRRVIPSATHATERRYGTLLQWGYSDQGIIGWVPEYSPGPEAWVPDCDGDGLITESDWHCLNDEAFGGKYFKDWTPFDHPQLGPVEIGGWHTKFWGQNPPDELLERELEVQLPWILYLAEQLPRVQVGEPRITPLGDERFQVEVTVTNEGYLPTNLTEQGLWGGGRGMAGAALQVSPPPLVVLTAEGATVEEGNGRVRISHLAGSSPFSSGVRDTLAAVSFTVRRESPGASIQITVVSDKGGTAQTAEVVLGEG